MNEIKIEACWWYKPWAGKGWIVVVEVLGDDREKGIEFAAELFNLWPSWTELWGNEIELVVFSV